MSATYFVEPNSVVRLIWGKSDTILLIFAGASAEFALNKDVDWLYFTGRLPADPLGRLFSTVSYARAIVFAEKDRALHTIDAMTSIHSHVETTRGMRIPDSAYRDVLFMLIDYSIRAFEVLERKMSVDEKNEVFSVFNRLGERMKIKGLPRTLAEWEGMRMTHLEQNLKHSDYTNDLFRQYRKQLGIARFQIMKWAQNLVVPKRVQKLLGQTRLSVFQPLINLYKVSRLMNADRLLKLLILPPRYREEIGALDCP